MFRPTTRLTTATVMTVLTLMTAGAAAAEETPTGEPKTFEYTTQNGGTFTATHNCDQSDKYDVQGCATQRSFTNADGYTVQKDTMVLQGPEHTRAFKRITGPRDHTRWRERIVGPRH